MKFGRILSGAAALAASLAMAGPAPAQPRPTFALVEVNQTAAFFTQLIDGAQRAAAKAGVDLIVFNANNDPVAQYNGIETYIQQKVNGIIVVAIDPNAITPAVKAAAAAGIPVVALDTVLPPGPQRAQVGVDQALAGKTIGEFLVKQLGGRTAKLGVVGALAVASQNLRQKSFEEVVRAAPNIHVVGVVDGRNNRDAAKLAVEGLFSDNPDLAAVYATGEPALLGAISAVESWSRQNTLKIVGQDLTPQAIAGIDAGYVLGVVQQDPAAEAAAAVDALVALSKGGTVEKFIAVPTTIVDKANVDAFRASFK